MGGAAALPPPPHPTLPPRHLLVVFLRTSWVPLLFRRIFIAPLFESSLLRTSGRGGAAPPHPLPPPNPPPPPRALAVCWATAAFGSARAGARHLSHKARLLGKRSGCLCVGAGFFCCCEGGGVKKSKGKPLPKRSRSALWRSALGPPDPGPTVSFVAMRCYRVVSGFNCILVYPVRRNVRAPEGHSSRTGFARVVAGGAHWTPSLCLEVRPTTKA